MANLNFWLSQSQLHHDYNPYISIDLDGFTDEQWYPYHESIVSKAHIFSLATHHPVEANGHALNHVKTNSYFDDYYNRIHISPSTLTLGNIASEQTQAVNIWNAYLVPKTLLNIENITEGIEVSGQPNNNISISTAPLVRSILNYSQELSVFIINSKVIDRCS